MPGLRDRKTPGVYVTEFAAFPPSAVGIETAIPAFIGYTCKADIQGRAVVGIPIRITSLAEYHDVFGGAPKTVFDFEDGDDKDFDLQFDATTFKRLKRSGEVGLLYHSLHLFYANGGATCFVVSVGPYEEKVDSAKLKLGVQALDDQVGPTMLVVPDLSLLPRDKTKRQEIPGFREVAVAMLNQCGTKQDRVALLDVVHARGIGRKSPINALDDAIKQFRTDVEHEFRDYGIAYFPSLNTSIVRPTDLNYTRFGSHHPQLVRRERGRQALPRQAASGRGGPEDGHRVGRHRGPGPGRSKRLASRTWTLPSSCSCRPTRWARESLGVLQQPDPTTDGAAKTVATAPVARRSWHSRRPSGRSSSRRATRTSSTRSLRSRQLYALRREKLNRLPATCGDGRRHDGHRQHPRRLERAGEHRARTRSMRRRSRSTTRSRTISTCRSTARRSTSSATSSAAAPWSGARARSTATATTSATSRCAARSSTSSSRSRRR